MLNLRETWLANQVGKLCQKKVMSYKNSQIPTLPKKDALQLSYQAHLGLKNSLLRVCFPCYPPPTSSISEILKVKQYPDLPYIKCQQKNRFWKLPENMFSKNIILNTTNNFVQMLKSEREILFYNFYLIKNANMPASLN